MASTVTLSEHGRYMQSKGFTPLTAAKRQVAWARSAIRRIEKQKAAAEARLAKWTAEVERLEAEKAS